MPGAPSYAEAFSPPPGRCFRMVTGHGGGAGPTHCPEPVAWRGSRRVPNGRRYRIEACEGHRPPEEGGPTAWMRSPSDMRRWASRARRSAVDFA